MAIFAALKLSITVCSPALASEVLRGLDLTSFWRFSYIASVSSGGCSKPVSPFVMISGMPPVWLATIGRPQIIASRRTNPKASRRDGRTKMSELLRSFGIEPCLPRNNAFFWRWSFVIWF